MDLYTPLTAVGSIVGGIICLRIFWTLWSLVDGKINHNALDVTKHIQLTELKDALVNVHFKSGVTLVNVVLVGYCSTHQEAPYNFKQLLILEEAEGKRYYARTSEIEYFEQASV